MEKISRICLMLGCIIPAIALNQPSSGSFLKTNDQGLIKTELAVISRPGEYEFSKGFFNLKNEIKIFGNTPKLDDLVGYTAKTLLEDAGISASSIKTNLAYLKLELIHMKPDSDKEGYSMDINNNGIAIKASIEAGLFYGIQTIRQMILACKTPDSDCLLPFVIIKDQPRFAWRAFMLDEARYFKGKEQYLFSFTGIC